MHEINLILAALVASLEDRLKGVDEKVVQTHEGVKNAEQKVTDNNKEYAKISLLSALMGKRENLLDAQAICLQEEMTFRTRAEAWALPRD